MSTPHRSHVPQSSQQPEQIKLWVLMLGGVAFIVALYATYLMFGPGRQGGTNDNKRRPAQPVRELRQTPSVPDHTGDLARSKGTNRDTDLPETTKQQLAALGFGSENGNPMSVGVATNIISKRK